MKKELTINFGLIAPTILIQLKKQGLKFDTKKVRHFQKQSEAIHTLAFSDIITDSEIKRCFDKSFNKIKTHVLKMNPSEK